jgi:hypothetical protein
MGGSLSSGGGQGRVVGKQSEKMVSRQGAKAQRKAQTSGFGFLFPKMSGLHEINKILFKKRPGFADEHITGIVIS